ncbi:MAG: hypothetical protein LBM69_02865 [Lachnospiraceae bacterium]|nr:hypothetical protein [Lachnospiraceae bacterium]
MSVPNLSHKIRLFAYAAKYYICPILLLVYAFRHVTQGVDLWDTGYNYSNFTYMGTLHMDDMWLLTTYLANAVGRLLTLLPGGATMVGMNVYTSMIVAGIALGAYFFFLKTFSCPFVLIFISEIIALSLCWAPSALIYHYLTYFLFNLATILLYFGLVKDKSILLVSAGVALGLNVGVRFSNLPQIGLILAAWWYWFMQQSQENNHRTQAMKRVLFGTLRCAVGFVISYGLFVGYLSIRYGFMEYVRAIIRLFAMTEDAPDYTATAMLYGMVKYYRTNLYWTKWIIGVVVLGMVVLFIAEHFVPKRWIIILKILSALACIFVWYQQFQNYFYTIDYASYDSILRPCVHLMTIAILIAVVVCILPSAPPQDKLISALVTLILLLTSLGSNNAIYTSINNLFLVMPYILWMTVRWLSTTTTQTRAALFPVKFLVVLTISVVFIQSVGFGIRFVYAEAAGVRGERAKVENNPVLDGMWANETRAKQLSEISAYVYGQGLEKIECILYGQIPSLSYYLQMPPAINSWSDLLSYQVEVMEHDFHELSQRIASGIDKPVIIVTQSIANTLDTSQSDPKLQLIKTFMSQYSYEKTFENEAFVIFES